MQIEISFSKKGDMKYISHLDLMRLFQRASRRACMPVSATSGFSPHLKISIKRALKLGLESEEEQATFCLKEKVEPNQFIKNMNKELPYGIRIINAKIN